MPISIIDGRSKNATRHGMTGTRTYYAWSNMIKRCQPGSSSDPYGRYAKRGIKVCERWRLFDNFLADMGVCPDGLTLERKNNDKGYCKSNCIWASRLVQARNRQSNKLITHDGKTKSMAEWAEYFGMKKATLWRRLKVGTPFHLAVSAPLKMGRKTKEYDLCRSL